MTTEAQIEANRRNSQRSTGPRTAEGKSVSRRNALRHGLAARTLVVAPWEDEAEFAMFAADMRADLAPDGACEEALAQRIVLCAWRLERLCRIEADMLMGEASLLATDARAAGTEIEPPVGAWPAEMTALARYEATLDRAMERAMKLLRERQKARLAGELPDAADDSAERSQSAASPAPESAERSQFAEPEDEEELPSPQDIIARREAERLERARLINESCRPKARAAS